MKQRARRAPRLRCAVRSGLVAAAILWGSAAPALALPPANLAPLEQGRAKKSFARFAEDWMAKVRRLAERERRSPTIGSHAHDPLLTYRGYADDFSIELRATGHPRAPFVGLLRYVELLYSCSDTRTDDCKVSSALPVTEIFRFQNGRWVY
ncbi:MAG: hypothetical protein OEM05_13560 [Myxococcales bacterium]|nr:hypothetical protein [Myxococcales bacterium]